jgi:Recombinase
MPDAKTPMQKQREERRALGWRDVNIWLKPEGLARVARLQQPGESLSDVMDRALAALEAWQNGKAASQGTGEIPRDTSQPGALRAFITNEISRYLSSETFREGILALLQQSPRALPSDITSYLTSDEISAPAIPTRAHVDKAGVLKRIREMKAKGLSLQAIANRLNTEGVPTLSGKGRWQKGTIGNLLAHVKD